MRAIVVQTIGLVAGGWGIASWTPQLRKTWRTHSAKDLSWLALSGLAGGVALWIVYGALIHSIALLVTQGITEVLMVSLMLFKLRADRHAERQEINLGDSDTM
jgi:MtN3 and saliva related transmembrane protein